MNLCKLNIRATEMSDLDYVLDIYVYARDLMRKNGNPNQWGINRPTKDVLIKDILDRNSYVVEHEEKICGTFAFLLGEDPTYQIIDDGDWKNSEPYGTIHRIASDGSISGVMNECLVFCEQQIDNIRIDTHADNSIMQHILMKNGFERCGIIYVEDGSSRLAYQKVKLPK